MTTTEVLGFITGIAGVWLTIRQNPSCFPVGLVNVILSLILFFEQKLYADVLQQIVYIILLLYGWYHWLRPGKKAELPVTRLNGRDRITLGSAVFGTALLLGLLLYKFTDASLPYLDSFATSLAFGAQYLVARKKIENWILWFPVNLIYIGIYINKALPLYAILFSVYFILAIAGFLQWKKELKNENENSFSS